MKKFKDYMEDVAPTQVSGLESFRPLMDQSLMLLRNIPDPAVKSQVTPIVNTFYSQMRQILAKHAQASTGYSTFGQPGTVTSAPQAQIPVPGTQTQS